jgi:hypothetical protein
MPDAVTWNRRVTLNPAKYGTSMEHIKRVEKRIAALLAADERMLIKLRKREDALEPESNSLI